MTQVALTTSAPTQRRTEDQEALIVMAERAILNGRPWQATELLDSLVGRPESRSPRLVVVAARAAAGWGGWSRVERLLTHESWLDSLDGEGHALLTRAALAHGSAEGGVLHARKAVRLANDSTRPGRLVLLARSLDRLDRRDDAAVTYGLAAEDLPVIRDWLILRVVAVTDDSTRRANLLSTITLPAARGRRGWANASGAEGAGRWEEAERLYQGLGARLRAVALRLEHTESGSERERLRGDLVKVLEGESVSDNTGAVIDLLDRTFAPLTPEEELLIARRSSVSGSATRAASAFAVAAAAGLLAEHDHFTYGTILVRLGRNREAITQFRLVRTSRRKGEAAYQAARTRMRMGEVTLALRELRAVAREHASDPTAAGTALFLIGDLLTDRGENSGARKAFLDLGRRYPGHRYAATGRLRAALLAYQSGDASDAAAELDALRLTRSSERAAATYWAGRAWQLAGDSLAASVRWAAAANLDDEYYGLLAVRALGRKGWRPPRSVRERTPLVWLPDALERIDILSSLGLAQELIFERRWITEHLGRAAERTVEAARVMDSAGRHHLAVRYAIRAQGRGATSDRTLVRLLYPLPFPGILETESQNRNLDPLLVASLIRQESAYDPSARSRADARGLMQVLPSVGRQLAPRLGIGAWDPVLLYQAEVNLRMGTMLLARALRRYPHLVHALAAYNAGDSRVTRWLETPGAMDPEWFAERIPIRETRDYVRRIIVNLARYKSIYSDH